MIGRMIASNELNQKALAPNIEAMRIEWGTSLFRHALDHRTLKRALTMRSQASRTAVQVIHNEALHILLQLVSFIDCAAPLFYGASSPGESLVNFACVGIACVDVALRIYAYRLQVLKYQVDSVLLVITFVLVADCFTASQRRWSVCLRPAVLLCNVKALRKILGSLLHTIPHMLEMSWFYFVIIVMWASWAQMTLNSSYSADDAQGIDNIVCFQF